MFFFFTIFNTKEIKKAAELKAVQIFNKMTL